MPNIREKIQQNIVHYRKEAKLKQSELAEKIGVSKTTLGSWEQGKSMPDIDKLYELSRVLGVDLVTISGFRLRDTQADELSLEEQQLITDYREFNAEGKEKVRDYVADLKHNPKYKKRDEPALGRQA